MNILVTGGAGYIGSTVCSALKENGYTPIVLDSLINGREEFGKRHTFYQGDVADADLVKKIHKEHPFNHVIHLAALISVPESAEKPYEYYRENVVKGLTFFQTLNEIGCKNIIFSSSASVYGNAEQLEVTEESFVSPESPYARTKAMVENVLQDFAVAYGMKAIALRYFNPIGADPKFRTGSYIKNPSHILGILIKAYHSEEKKMTITGVDWPTRDGSGVRDYIHVWDLAMAHVSALDAFDKIEGFEIINIGRGEGITVKEFVADFEDVIGGKLNVSFGPPRDGDVAGAYAICDKAKSLLSWEAALTVRQGIKDALEWDEKKGF